MRARSVAGPHGAPIPLISAAPFWSITRSHQHLAWPDPFSIEKYDGTTIRLRR